MNEKVKLIIVIACLAIAGLIIVVTQTDIFGGGPGGGSQAGGPSGNDGSAAPADDEELGVPEDGEGPVRVETDPFRNSR